MTTRTVSQILLEDYSISIRPGAKGECPQCHNSHFSLKGDGTGSVSCNSVFVLHLCRFLNQEDLMEREAMVQNP